MSCCRKSYGAAVWTPEKAKVAYEQGLIPESKYREIAGLPPSTRRIASWALPAVGIAAITAVLWSGKDNG